MATCHRVAVNPNNAGQIVAQWTDGRLESIGPVAVSLPDTSQYPVGYQEGTAPRVENFGPFRIIAFTVTDWSTDPISGFTGLNKGQVFAWGPNATQPELNQQPGTFVDSQFVDFVMNPNGDGTGYFQRIDGYLPPIGGSASIDERPIPGQAQRVIMPDFTTKKYWVLDTEGRYWRRHEAPALASPGFSSEQQLFGGTDTLGAAVAAHVFEDPENAGVFLGWGAINHGFVYALNDAQIPYGWELLYTPGFPTYSDMAVLDDGSGDDPLRIGLLPIYGVQLWEYVVSTPPKVFVTAPVTPVELTTRPDGQITYTDPEGDALDASQWRWLSEAQYLDGSEVDEVQEFTTTGAPDGGSSLWVVPWSGEPITVPWNTTAAALEDLFEALPSVEPGDIACTGGPLNTTPIQVAMQNRLGAHDWPLIEVDSALLENGTDPEVAAVENTAGVGIDPAEIEDPLFAKDYGREGRDVRSVSPTVDFANGNIRLYVRAKDTSNQFSPWNFREWVQDVVVPAAPTLVVTEDGPLGAALLDITGVELEGSRFAVRFRDPDMVDWRWVLGAAPLNDLVPEVDHAQASDFPTPGVQRTYQAVQFIPDPVLVGTFSTDETITIESDDFTLIDPFAATGVILGVRGRGDLETRKPNVVGTFYPDRRYDPNNPDEDGAVVVTSGGPRGGEQTLPLQAFTQGDYAALSPLFSRPVLLYRTPYGKASYITVNGDLVERLIEGMNGEGNELDLPVAKSRVPLAGPIDGPLALVG